MVVERTLLIFQQFEAYIEMSSTNKCFNIKTEIIKLWNPNNGPSRGAKTNLFYVQIQYIGNIHNLCYNDILKNSLLVPLVPNLR